MLATVLKRMRYQTLRYCKYIRKRHYQVTINCSAHKRLKIIIRTNTYMLLSLTANVSCLGKERYDIR